MKRVKVRRVVPTPSTEPSLPPAVGAVLFALLLTVVILGMVYG